MLVPDRRRRLLDEVRRLGSAQVDDLAGALAVSASTVRRDLALLEADGLLLRAHGGAYIRRLGEPAAVHVGASSADDTDAKARIGALAAQRVQDGMTVMILAGSTTATMLTHLAHRSVTVVTNGLDIAAALSAYPDIELVVLGGVLHREQMTLLGPLAVQGMANLHVDVLFAGAWGVDARVGVTGAKANQAGYQHSMLQHATSLVVLAEAAKFGRQGPTVIAGIDQVDAFVTDSAVDPHAVEALRERGATVDIT